MINKKSSDRIAEIIYNSGLQIGLIDAASEGKEFDDTEGGVGLARKIGIDTALKVFDYSISGKKIIIFLDADCLVEKNYLDEIVYSFTKNNFSAANVEFEHNLSEAEINRLGIISYEIFLRHYVVGSSFCKISLCFSYHWFNDCL